MSKHTPGPWGWSDDGGQLVATGHLSGAWILWPRNISCECDARRDGWASALGSPDATDEQSEANARLIAAAPDLLNAAEQALSDLQWIESQDQRNNMQASIILLRHAITKATGEQR